MEEGRENSVGLLFAGLKIKSAPEALSAVAYTSVDCGLGLVVFFKIFEENNNFKQLKKLISQFFHHKPQEQGLCKRCKAIS